ncbi:MAG: ComEC/Rec2 family competence protein, partial [Alistipes sp.]|nr:ComEC/Rec2 family competence protein [Alistipes sp.]
MDNDKPTYKLSPARLRQRLQGLPMLRVLLPFACGIVLAMHYTLPIGYLTALLLFCGVATLITRRAIYTFCLLVVAGVLNIALREEPAELPIGQRASFRIRVETPVALRKGFGDGEGTLTAWRDPQTGVWHTAQGCLLLRADSLTQLAPGEEICFEGRIYPLRGGSPSYRRLMHSRGFIGRCYLQERHILSRERTDQLSLHQRAAAALAQLPESHQAGLAVVRAMTVGDRSDLSRTLRDTYSRSGMSHLLAISGLHTGIVFLLLNLLLYWMPMLRYGLHLRNLLTIV